MKKRLIFVNNNLHSGGIQRSLLNLLANLQGQCQITLLLMSDTGEYREQLPPEIQVLHCPPLLRILGMSQRELWPKAKGLYFLRSFLVVLCRIIGNSLPLRVLSFFQKQLGPYDIAISCMQSERPSILYGGANEIVLYRIQAEKKIAMVHADILHCGSNTPAVRKLYGQFDSILTCSKGCRDHFLCAFPELRDLVRVVPNFHDFVGISYFSNQNPVVYPRDKIHVITVARLSGEKGLERALEAVQACVAAGIPISYQIVGDGPKRAALQKYAVKLGVSACVAFHRFQENPYRFMRNADLFLLPSYHEAAPLVFTEAKYLGLPILATHTSSVRELILEDHAGWVCENTTQDIVHCLKQVCSNPKVLKEKRDWLSRRMYTNEEAAKQWNNLLNNQEP
ncbi:MAG: glycosyltransferase [Anaeromassilibacillus sp.]